MPAEYMALAIRALAEHCQIHFYELDGAFWFVEGRQVAGPFPCINTALSAALKGART